MSKERYRLYYCDPTKHKDCPKTDCFIIGGNCDMTQHKKFAKNPNPIIFNEEGEEINESQG